MENIVYKEQIVRKAGKIGNGSHVFVPKEWENEEVLIVRIGKKSIKEEIIDMLFPYLDKVMGVFIFGSHARGEFSENSDIDVLIIAKEKFKIEKRKDFEIIIIEESRIKEAIKTNPIMMYSIFKEAKPLINTQYLENLEKLEIDRNYFKKFIYSSYESIKSDKEILLLDKRTGKTASNAVVYSLILRLRGIFIINRLFKKQKYSNKLFKEWILNNCKIELEKAYESYQSIRDNKRKKDILNIEDAEMLLNFLEKELKKLGNLLL